jgi:hypothetical protein
MIERSIAALGRLVEIMDRHPKGALYALLLGAVAVTGVWVWGH